IREFPPVSILGHETHTNTGLLHGDPTKTIYVDEANGLVEFCAHEVGVDGTETVGCDTLRFRSEEHLRTMLSEAGLVVDEVFGGFEGEPTGQGIGSLVITAHKP
ncbi:hypothetical protein ACFSFX_12870, partial [Arthrobacter flavus]